MAAFLLALAGVFAVSLGGRDQLLCARLSERLGGPIVVAVGAVASMLSAAAMALGGVLLAAQLPAPARTMLVAIALLFATLELAWPHRARLPAEPTRSLFAILIVLLARQLGDAARFLVFALAAGGFGALAGLGGALGGAAAVALGVALGGELETRWPLRAIRRGLAGVLALAAIALALSARGVVG